ncbi:polysaccharide pyruvyl transferase family protein [Paenarthrobacter sp. OM7]|uniref:polysaccharide pyruvyl transferase family protein n=1 Tax=Paenarthrobacter sp. OM7 TaxID=3041264 RepID=UPI0024684A44|nr:polysaccharide pyruvyl transferase family protein [Paenarthrobacter sp. OM7]WGM22815.1 polysaccharide pyruvyl transferase family protein [Paenarthrobacter sp. OM7]
MMLALDFALNQCQSRAYSPLAVEYWRTMPAHSSSFPNTLEAALDADGTQSQHSASTPGRHLILRSGWQIENIGDVAHTPGALALLEQYLPEVEVTFWPFYSVLPQFEIDMLMKRFPRLNIVQGSLDERGVASTPELEAAIASADFMLHNSGPFGLAWKDLVAFRERTGNPFGFYGITYGHWVFGNAEREALSNAEFVYFRDSVSLERALQDGVSAPVMEYSPDVVFALDIADDEAAERLMKKYGLVEGNFMCCFPKQRFTPTWLHKAKNRPFDSRLHQRNEEMKEHDHIPLREAITAVVRETGMKVLICNEDETELPIGKTWVLDHLPEDVKENVAWLDRTWLLEEAVGVYKRSAGLFSNEMHSPIMAIANGVPAIVNRWVEQSSKGRMWEDIGLDDWLFNFDDDKDVARFPGVVLEMAKEPEKARLKAVAARDVARRRLEETIAVVSERSGLKS